MPIIIIDSCFMILAFLRRHFVKFYFLILKGKKDPYFAAALQGDSNILLHTTFLLRSDNFSWVFRERKMKIDLF